ncbi:T3SS (YopN, CesT) and YbjN peptide-binding chaperone 1 [Mycolicibacterium arenosum]|uniref:YbjN domain-containing protein n=1 Tax=Mycolicibacterium arenosum TaxID=2952157 RepID=A0ABT1M463_9MYCO|nr:YbjN domain-containing protein [Mycolicibacterium sp. CAU 1645]MCP9273956.1 YbjN domain-containing protein [Mycolicibacterium sp. CAU 1645]
MSIHTERAQLDELLERIPDTIDFDVEDAEGCRDLGRWLELTLRHRLGLAFIARDETGGIPVPLGDNVVHVRYGDGDEQFVTVSTLLLEDAALTPELYEAVNAINAHTPLAKTVIDTAGRRIVTSVDLEVVDTLSPHDLMLAIEIVGRAAEQFGCRLQSRFGSVDA